MCTNDIFLANALKLHNPIVDDDFFGGGKCPCSKSVKNAYFNIKNTCGFKKKCHPERVNKVVQLFIIDIVSVLMQMFPHRRLHMNKICFTLFIKIICKGSITSSQLMLPQRRKILPVLLPKSETIFKNRFPSKLYFVQIIKYIINNKVS